MDDISGARIAGQLAVHVRAPRNTGESEDKSAAPSLVSYYYLRLLCLNDT